MGLFLSVFLGLSTIRESNPPPQLGKLIYYRCTNRAKIARFGDRVWCIQGCWPFVMFWTVSYTMIRELSISGIPMKMQP